MKARRNPKKNQQKEEPLKQTEQDISSIPVEASVQVRPEYLIEPLLRELVKEFPTKKWLSMNTSFSGGVSDPTAISGELDRLQSLMNAELEANLLAFNQMSRQIESNSSDAHVEKRLETSFPRAFYEENNLINVENIVSFSTPDVSPWVSRTIETSRAKTSTKHLSVNMKSLAKKTPAPSVPGTSLPTATQSPKLSAKSVSIDQILTFSPSVVVFQEYEIGTICETTITVTNSSLKGRRIIISPPKGSQFSMKQVKYPHETAHIAPGMSCQVTIIFTADSLKPIEDALIVRTEADGSLHSELLIGKIKIIALRANPQLTLSSVLNCGFSLLQSPSIIPFPFQNRGGTSRFKIMISEQVQEIFQIQPTEFTLHRGESTTLYVTFTPKDTIYYQYDFNMIFDNSEQRFSLVGGGTVPLFGITGVDNQPVDTDLMLLSSYLTFPKVTVGSSSHKKLSIRNYSAMKLPFRWEFYQQSNDGSEAQPLHAACFSVCPSSGIFDADIAITFQVEFNPSSLGNVTLIGRMIIENVPNCIPLILEREGIPPFVKTRNNCMNLHVIDVELSGNSSEMEVFIAPPAILFAGPLTLGQTYTRDFLIVNQSFSDSTFEWMRISDENYQVQASPETGIVNANSITPITLSITSKQEGPFDLDLLADFPYSQSTLKLKGSVQLPLLKLDRTCIDFQMVQTDSKNVQEISLFNESAVPVTWEIEFPSDFDHSFVISPSNGICYPNSKASLSIVFRPSEPTSNYSSYFLVKIGDTFQKVYVKANVLAPQVIIEPKILELGTSFVDVPVSCDCLLNNKSPLSTEFLWEELQTSDFSVSFEPTFGIIKPNSSLAIKVTFVGKKLHKLMDHVIVCFIAGQKIPSAAILKSKIEGVSISYCVGGSKNLNELSPLTPETANQSCIDFGEIPVFSAKSASIILHNNTPISTTCHMNVLRYGSSQDQRVNFITSESGSSIVVGGSSSSSSMGANGGTGSSGSGSRVLKMEEFPELRSISEDNDLLLNHTKGLILDATVEGKSTSSALITPYSTIKIDLCCYNNMNGLFQDTFICSIDGMSSVEFPVKGNVIGNPLTVFLASGASRIPVSSLRWNNSPSFKKNSKKFEVINKSVVDVQVSWKISPKSYTPDSSSLFSISPSTMIIGSYKAAMFNVTFHPEGGGTFQVNLIGDTIVVDPHQIQLQDFNNPPPLSIELIGHSVAP